tara:strand:- start:21972 stop:23717 length:1746 start_codon:yes stop_codon:yes gene_type:complete
MKTSLIIATKKFFYKKNILYLGHWAVPSNQLFSRSISKKVLKYHWDDRKKLNKDYLFLKKFSFSILDRLTPILNKIHGVKYSRKYWIFLLFPWLLSYVSIIFDRWETISKIKKKKSCFVFFNRYNEFSQKILDYNHLLKISQTDEWNEKLYFDIVRYKNLDYRFINNNKISKNKKIDLNVSFFKKYTYFLLRIIFFIVNIFVKKASRKNLIIDTNFGYFFYRKFLNKNIYTYGLSFAEKINNFYLGVSTDLKSRKKFIEGIHYKISEKKSFSSFFNKILKNDFPTVYLENYNYLNNPICKKTQYKSITTSFMHFQSISDKFQYAKHIINKTKLFILEHGGSLPAFKEIFNFEEMIANKKFTFYKPILKKQKKIKFNVHEYKILNIKKTLGKNCSIFCGETPMWNYRVQYYATSSQSLYTYRLLVSFIKNLDKNIQTKCKIKTKTILNGFNFKWHYRKEFKDDIIYKKNSIVDFIQDSKILILSYPETTLIEAILSNRPFILLYSKKFYERHSSTKKIIIKLKKNKIIFFSAVKAANHINKYWKDPYSWFGLTDVQDCLEEFKKKYILTKSFTDYRKNDILF